MNPSAASVRLSGFHLLLILNHSSVSESAVALLKGICGWRSEKSRGVVLPIGATQMLVCSRHCVGVYTQLWQKQAHNHRRWHRQQVLTPVGQTRSLLPFCFPLFRSPSCSLLLQTNMACNQKDRWARLLTFLNKLSVRPSGEQQLLL